MVKTTSKANVPLLGFAGFSGSGKTTLLEKLITYFSEKNIAIALIKHAHHSFDMDHKGKDSYRHRQAGACEILIGSEKRYAHLVELKQELTLDELIAQVNYADVIFVEGYKNAPIDKIEIYRSDLGKPLLVEKDSHIVAVASPQKDADKLRHKKNVTWLDLDDMMMVANFITEKLHLKID